MRVALKLVDAENPDAHPNSRSRSIVHNRRRSPPPVAHCAFRALINLIIPGAALKGLAFNLLYRLAGCRSIAHVHSSVEGYPKRGGQVVGPYRDAQFFSVPKSLSMSSQQRPGQPRSTS